MNKFLIAFVVVIVVAVGAVPTTTEDKSHKADVKKAEEKPPTTFSKVIGAIVPPALHLSVPVAVEAVAASSSTTAKVPSVSTDALVNDNKKFRTDCIKEIGVTAEAVDKLKAGDFSSKDEKIQCFTKCYFEKSGFLNGKGDFQDKVAVEKLIAKAGAADKSKVEGLVNKCKDIKGANPCAHAYGIYECYSNAKKAL